jgi:hypothetical protein
MLNWQEPTWELNIFNLAILCVALKFANIPIGFEPTIWNTPPWVSSNKVNLAGTQMETNFSCLAILHVDTNFANFSSMPETNYLNAYMCVVC